jgi:hypothetical protein
MRTIKYIITALIIPFWLLLSHVSLARWDNRFDIKIWAQDHKYHVVKKRISPINPIGVFCELATEDAVYFVLYDEEGEYIGQTSPFICYSSWIDTPISFPGDDISSDKNSFKVFCDKYDEELTINTKQRRWWSQILAIIN